MKKIIFLASLLVTSYSFAAESVKVNCKPAANMAGGVLASVVGTLNLSQAIGGIVKAEGTLKITIRGKSEDVAVIGTYQKYNSFNQLNLGPANTKSPYNAIFIDFKDTKSSMMSNLETVAGRNIFMMCGDK